MPRFRLVASAVLATFILIAPHFLSPRPAKPLERRTAQAQSTPPAFPAQGDSKAASLPPTQKPPVRFRDIATQIFQMKSGNACKADGRKICSILLLAIFGPIVRLQVENDFPRVFIRDRCAEGFVHLVDLGFPGGGGQRRLHGAFPLPLTPVPINL